MITAVTLRGAAWLEHGEHIIVGLGVAVALVFVGLCWEQNRRWRRRLADLLRWKLARTNPPDRDLEDRLAGAIAGHSDGRSDTENALLRDVARALATPDERLRALGEELLSELIPRAEAHAIAATARR